MVGRGVPLVASVGVAAGGVGVGAVGGVGVGAVGDVDFGVDLGTDFGVDAAFGVDVSF